MKKVLILGVGAAQVDALRWCRAAGLEVHACGLSEQGAGRKLADYFALIDIRNIQAVEEYARAHTIDLIYSVGSDAAMPTVAKVSEKLGLPSLFPSISAFICNNKHLMRQTLGPGFIGNLHYRVIRTLEDARTWDIFPCVMKPVDSQGQRGVMLLHSYLELTEHFSRTLSFSPSGQVILEECASGPEISVNVYSVAGQIKFLQLTDRIVFSEFPGGIVREHRIPATVSPAVEDSVHDLVRRVLEIISVPNGPAYFQIKLTDTGPKLLEVTPRLDGCHLWRLIREYCGVDLLDCTFRHLLGQPLPSFEKKSGATPLALVFPSGRPGEKVNLYSYNIGRPLYLEWYYEQGETIRPINGIMEKVGYFIQRLPPQTNNIDSQA